MALSSAAAFCAAAFIFYPSFTVLFHRWQEPVSYFDHAIFVPFVCLWMFARSRKASPGMPSGTDLPYVAFALLIAALVLQAFAASQQITFMHGMAIVLWVWASALWFEGTGGFKAHRWPLLYLLLLIPIPTFFMAQLTFGLRELSTALSAGILGSAMTALGLPFSRIGNELVFADHHVTIVDACSGMNTLLTIIAVGMILAYLESSRARAWIVTALLVPTAIAANLFRILVICALVACGGGAFAFGSGHALIGLTTVGTAIALLAFGIRYPGKRELRGPDAKPLPSRPVSMPAGTGNKRRPFRLKAYTALLVCGALASLTIRGSAPPPAHAESKVLPRLSLASWRSTELPMDEATYAVVGTRDAHMFRFDPVIALSPVPPAPPVFLYWVHSESSRKIGHPPELCYRSEGYDILAQSQEQLQIHGRGLPINRLEVDRDGYRLLVYYWYRIGGADTASYLEQQLRWTWNQLRHLGFMSSDQEGTMIRVSTEMDSPAAAENRLRTWITEED